MLRYSNYSNPKPEKFSNTFIGGQANYNFNQIGSGRFVPFIGLVLGFTPLTGYVFGDRQG